MKRLALLFAFALFLLLPTSVPAAECQFVLGFATLRDLIGHDIVGDCLEGEHYNATGDSVQQTTGGLLVWRKADNWTAFTDGYRTWINGPNGLAQRLNTEVFDWELAHALESLPWIQDGLNDNQERFVSDTLHGWVDQFPLVAWELAQTPWMRSSQLNIPRVHYYWMIQYIDTVVRIDEAAALRLIRMPFTQSVAFGSTSAWRTLAQIVAADPEGFAALLADPRLADGIRSDQAAEVSAIYLEMLDPPAAAAIRGMAWTYEDPWRAHELRILAQMSPPVFWAWIAQCRSYHDRCPGTLTSITELAQADEESALRIIKMPFLSTWNQGSDQAVLTYAAHLAEEDPASLRQVLSHPKLRGGITDDHITTFALLVLGVERPEAAAAIMALPWVRDGVQRPVRAYEVHAGDPAQWEEDVALSLVSIAWNSPEAALALVGRHWLRDGVSWDEQQVMSQLPWLVGPDPATALRLVEMPFLAVSASKDDSSIIGNLMDMVTYSPNPDKPAVLREVLDHPWLQGGIRDGYRHVVELLAVSRQNPEIAAAIESLPWIQDGIDASELQAMTVLYGVALQAPHYIPILVSHPWAQDGLDAADQNRVRRVVAERFGPQPTPTPSVPPAVIAAQRAIAALPWVEDDVEKPPDWGTARVSTLERLRRAHDNLQQIAEHAPEAAMALVGKRWLRDGVTSWEEEALRYLAEIAEFDAASALQIVEMSFLAASVTREDASILDTLRIMTYYSPNLNKREVLQEALTHPLLRGGIWDGYRTRVEFVAIGIQSPGVGAAIYSLPWIRDGVEGAEWQAITALYDASTRTPHFISELILYPWVRDGLNKDEQDRVRKLMQDNY